MGAPTETTDHRPSTKVKGQGKESRREPRSVSRERPSSSSSSRSLERGSPRQRSRSRSQSAEEPTTPRQRSTSRSKKEHVREMTSRNKDRSRSRERSKPPDGSRPSGKDADENREKTSRRDRSQSRDLTSGKPSRDRSKSRERSNSRDRSRPSGNGDENEGSSSRRRKKTTEERSKELTRRPSSYLKNSSNQRGRAEKDQSKGRKSSVLGSLTAFLEDGKAATPTKTTSGDRSVSRSVASSASRRNRRHRSITPSSASVVGGVKSSRDVMRAHRRSRSASIVRDGASKVPAKYGSKASGSDTGSSRPAKHGSKVSGSSDTDSSRPQEGEVRDRRPRRASMTSSGPEVPPGFPAAAVERNSAAVSDQDTTDAMNTPINPSVMESTAQLRQRQQLRASLNGSEPRPSTLDPGVENFRKSRRRSSIELTEASAPPPASEEDQAPESTPEPPPTRRKSRRRAGIGDEEEAMQSSTREEKSRSTRNSKSPTPAEKSRSTRNSKSPTPAEKSRSTRNSKSPTPAEKSRSTRNSKSPTPAERSRSTRNSKSPTPAERSKASRKSSSRRSTQVSSSESAVPDPTSSSTRAQPDPKEKNPSVLDTLADKLAEVGKNNGSRKSSRKSSSGRSVSSAPALSDKHSTSRRRSSSRSKREKGTRKQAKASSGLETLLGVPSNSNMNDLGNASMASLDPSLLKRTQGVSRISSIAEIYHEDVEEEQLSPHDKPAPKSIGELFRQEYGSPGRCNQSMVSFDTVQLQQVASAFGGGNILAPPTPPPTPPSMEDDSPSPGCLRRKSGQATIESPNKGRRVSWLELPLHNPQELLIKSTDTDGSNETSKTATMDEVPTGDAHEDDSDQDDEPSSEATSKPAVKPAESSLETSKAQSQTDSNSSHPKPNPSLDAAFGRKKGARSRKQGSDERTVATTTTTDTSNTNTSESTYKTNNRSPLDLKTERITASGSGSSSEPAAAEPSDKNQDSLTAEDLINHDSPAGGSSSSLSRSSLIRRRTNSSDGSSSSLSRMSRKSGESSEKKVRRRSSKAHGTSKTKDRSRGESKESSRQVDENRERRPGSESKDHPKQDSPREGRRRSKRSEADTSPLRRNIRAGDKIKFVASGSNDSQDSGEPTEEKVSKPKVKLQQHNSIGSEDGSKARRRKSYLPRNSTRCDSDKSRDHRSSIDASLDKFLERVDANGPIIKDDNRSVYSALQDKDRKKRIIDKKRDEKVSRRISRNAPPKRGVEPHASDDSMSVVSVPLLSSKQARELLDDHNRPVVNLKMTAFSKKLQKLHVAF